MNFNSVLLCQICSKSANFVATMCSVGPSGHHLPKRRQIDVLSRFETYICWKVLREENVDSLSTTIFFLLCEATTLIFVVNGAHGINSLVERSPNFWNMVVPTDITTMVNKFGQMSTSHFMMLWEDSPWIPLTFLPMKHVWKRTTGDRKFGAHRDDDALWKHVGLLLVGMFLCKIQTRNIIALAVHLCHIEEIGREATEASETESGEDANWKLVGLLFVGDLRCGLSLVKAIDWNVASDIPGHWVRHVDFPADHSESAGVLGVPSPLHTREISDDL